MPAAEESVVAEPDSKEYSYSGRWEQPKLSAQGHLHECSLVDFNCGTCSWANLQVAGSGTAVMDLVF